MNADMQKLEQAVRATPGYARAQQLLGEREHLEQQLQRLDHELETLAVAAKLARIDRLRTGLLASAHGMPPVG